MTDKTLAGRRYLVVEDEYLIASDLLTTLERAGATVYGPVSDVDHAMEILSEPGFTLDAAILDINLQGRMVYPAATQLANNGTPFIFVTGYECNSMSAEFAETPCLSKPFDDETLIRALADISATRQTQQAL